MRRFLQSFSITGHLDEAVVIHCDSTAVIAYARDLKYHSRTKHIDTRYHFIRDIITQGQVVLRHISTSNMIANPLTKPIARDVIHRHVSGLGLRRI